MNKGAVQMIVYVMELAQVLVGKMKNVILALVNVLKEPYMQIKNVLKVELFFLFEHLVYFLLTSVPKICNCNIFKTEN